uniref:Uncharacterized protein n=1 Tax=Dulem virus 42 TaxID=3145760 RepID=A0AAU8BAX7_9CAUD
MASYNSEINSILTNEAYIQDGRVKYELISDEDWNKLQRLYAYKKLLRSDYDMYGNKKEGESLFIAQALREFDATIRGEDPKSTEKKNRKPPKKNVEAWKAEMNKVIDECGGKEAFDLYRQGKRDDESGFNSKRWKKWEHRNVNRVLKRDKDGNVIVWQKIKEALRGIEPNYGKKYDELKQRAQDLLAPFKDERGEVVAELLSNAIQGELLNIYYQMAKIKKESKGYSKIAERKK